jgi:hypothetical protein
MTRAIVRVLRATTHSGRESEFERLLVEQSMPMVEGAEVLSPATSAGRLAPTTLNSLC